jgi:manganese/zinc/iron transport system ATP- binding protein
MIETINNPIIKIQDLTVSYENKPVLWNINLTLPPQKIIGILGPNGAGKSTLLKTIMGLIKANSGSIQILNNSIDKINNLVSYIPQKEAVNWNFPASVYEVVMMGRYIHMKGIIKREKEIDKKIVDQALERTGIQNIKNKQIAELSGGQQQRVFIARALAQQATIYFMDEPFAGIDITTESTIIKLLKDMVKEGKTIILVHHDLYSVTEYFDWAVMLNIHLIASGNTKNVFTTKVLKETYGSKLTILSDLSNIIQKEEIPIRDQDYQTPQVN